MNKLEIKYSKIEIIDNCGNKLGEIEKKIPKTFEFASNFKSEKVQIQTLLSKLMIVENLDCGEGEIIYNKLKKPYVDNKPFFNISHSRDYIVYVESRKEIGIDIEQISEKNLSIIDYAFTEEERKFIQDETRQFVDDEKTKFTYLWTIKEALFKASGTDTYAEPKKIIIEDVFYKFKESSAIEKSQKNDIAYITITQEYLGKTYHIYSLRFLNYIISVASEEQYDKIELNDYKFKTFNN